MYKIGVNIFDLIHTTFSSRKSLIYLSFALFYLQHHDVLVWGDSSIKKSIELLYNEGQELKFLRIQIFAGM